MTASFLRFSIVLSGFGINLFAAYILLDFFFDNNFDLTVTEWVVMVLLMCFLNLMGIGWSSSATRCSMKAKYCRN